MKVFTLADANRTLPLVTRVVRDVVDEHPRWRELDEIGCHLKGYEEGTVDFYSRHQNRLVFLCWRLGEDAISHWHELDGGFAGRHATAPDFEAEPVGRLP